MATASADELLEEKILHEDENKCVTPAKSSARAARPPSPTRSSVLKAEFARSRPWPRMVGNTIETPPWMLDTLSTPRSMGARYNEDDWSRLARPRAGYARDDLTGPPKKAITAVFARDDFLRAAGYIDNPRELLRKRFHGTSAEAARAQSSARASTQGAIASAELTKQQQQQMLRNCWRTGAERTSALERIPTRARAPVRDDLGLTPVCAHLVAAVALAQARAWA